ncbi:hypothetical protein BH20GEM1_BH20GEM1_10790 [soil metagenome]
MSATRDIKTIEFDARKLRGPKERRFFLAELAIAAGAVALAPAILGRRMGGLLHGQAETWAEREPGLSDIDILNYALTLEYLEATFYLRATSQGQLPGRATVAQIDPDGGGQPDGVEKPGNGRGRGRPFATRLASVQPPAPADFNVFQFVRTVRDHEIRHVLFLQAALGGAALDREDFAFVFPGAFDSVEAFLEVSQTLEDVGVTAYLGQVGNIDDAGILASAGSIALVEGEHAATFRYIRDVFITPDNTSFDLRRTSSQVLALASPFIAEAPPLPFP